MTSELLIVIYGVGASIVWIALVLWREGPGELFKFEEKLLICITWPFLVLEVIVRAITGKWTSNT